MESSQYRNGKIYKIVDIGYNECYVGSTIEALSKRMCQHRCYFNGNRPRPCNIIILFEKYGLENCKIELIENYPCNSKEELTAREGYHIKQNNCVNKIVAGRSKKQWYQNNADHASNKAKEYREQNKEHIKEIHRKYRVNHKEQINENHRKWCKDHMTERQIYNKIWIKILKNSSQN